MKSFRNNLILIGLVSLTLHSKAQSDPVKDPCEVLSASFIESIDGFKKSSEGRANMISSETWRVCDFLVDQRSMSVSLKRYDDRIIETKGVERTYQKILEQKDKMTRVEVQDAPGDQAIYTYGKTNLPGAPHKYLLQWRYGDHTEGMITISFGDKRDADKMLKQLIAIASKLDE